MAKGINDVMLCINDVTLCGVNDVALRTNLWYNLYDIFKGVIIMKAIKNLPESYREIYSIDLQNDKKKLVIVNGSAIVIAVLLVISMNFIVPFYTMFNLENGINDMFKKYGIIIISMIAYTILHEFVHGIAMKICGTKKVKYGFTGLYAFAGSEDFYNKKSYIFIALAPIVLWGVILGIVNAFVPIGWFWLVYLIQVINLSCAAGDLFVTIKFSRLPKDILIQDSGVTMKVFFKK